MEGMGVESAEVKGAGVGCVGESGAVSSSRGNNYAASWNEKESRDFGVHVCCMDTVAVIEELKDVAARLGVEVRTEPGNFRGGRCVVDDEEIIMLNENDLPETQLVVLAEALREAPLDTIYLKPAVRRALEAAWADAASAEASHGTD